MWQRSGEEEKKDADAAAAKKKHEIITDEIKEEEYEQSDLSDDENDKTKQDDSPGASSYAGSQRGDTFIGEGDDTEDTFMPLDEALTQDFDINKVSKLD